MQRTFFVLLVAIVAISVMLLVNRLPSNKQGYIKIQALTFEKSGSVYEEKISISPGLGMTLHAILEETGGVDTSLSFQTECLCSFGIYNSSLTWNSTFACDNSIKANARKTLSSTWDGLVDGQKLSEGNYKIYVACVNLGQIEKLEKDLIIKFNATDEECKSCIVT